MKIDPHDCCCPHRNDRATHREGVKKRQNWIFALILLFGSIAAVGPAANRSSAQTASATDKIKSIAPADADPARRLLARVIEQIALGPAFDAKFRQRVWVGGREVIGVGTYEQAGDGSGWFNMQVAMHDGDGKHTLQQISDGRLAWTREQIGDDVSLQRVDVGRLDQWVHSGANSAVSAPVYRGSLTSGNATDHRQTTARRDHLVDHLPPSVRVGGWTEMLESIAADHDLQVVSGRLEDRDVWIIRGSMRPDIREARLEEFGTPTWPELCPTQVVVAIAKAASPETGFGQGLPLRIEFWTDPQTNEPPNSANGSKDSGSAEDGSVDTSVDGNSHSGLASTGTAVDALSAAPKAPAEKPIAATQKGRLISLIELYSIRPISSPPIGRFRFENQDMSVNFTNDTDRYLTRYGIQITERQSRMLRR